MEKRSVTNLKKTSSKGYELTVFGETIKITEELVISYKLFQNRELTETEFSKLKAENILSKSYLRLVNALIKKRKSEKEIREKLYFSDLENEGIIAKLKELNLINDEEYFKDYIIYLKNKNKGPLFIKRKLKEKGVDPEKVMSVDSLCFKEELELFLNKNCYRYKSYPLAVQKQKLLRLSLENGFLMSEAEELINNLSLVDESLEELRKGIVKDLQKLSQTKIIQKYQRKGFNYQDIKNKLKEVNDETI